MLLSISKIMKRCVGSPIVSCLVSCVVFHEFCCTGRKGRRITFNRHDCHRTIKVLIFLFAKKICCLSMVTFQPISGDHCQYSSAFSPRGRASTFMKIINHVGTRVIVFPNNIERNKVKLTAISTSVCSAGRGKTGISLLKLGLRTKNF